MKISGSLVALALLLSMGVAHPSARAAAPPQVGSTSIGGTVMSAEGAEAGVWVIAETADLGNRLVKIVVTDDQGRFVLPDLPKANYKVWSRGYGLLDSERLDGAPGVTLKVKASRATSRSQAAQVYPTNYWASLIRAPAASEFPGTGPSGNGIAPAMKTQQHWFSQMIENCQYCHQLGNRVVRNLPAGDDAVALWEQRMHKARTGDGKDRGWEQRKQFMMDQFGHERSYRMFADWTTRIAKGEVPPAPPRPTGIERNVVVTMWDMGESRFIHSSTSTDLRNPTANANGPVYAHISYYATLAALDPATGKESDFRLTDAKGDYLNHINDNGNHYGAMDAKGRIWMSIERRTPGQADENQLYCTDPSNKFAKYYPRGADEERMSIDARGTIVFDPTTKKSEVVPTCVKTHHVAFDDNERLYFGSEKDVVGWLDVKVWDKTKDPAQSAGWCPLVVDTNGDGKITPDRSLWNRQFEGMDPTKDTRIVAGNHGLGISPKDQSYWTARSSPYLPPAVVRVETGANPPETCKTELYEVPQVEGQWPAFPPKGVELDAQGVAWITFGSGALGRFDRSKCNVINGPTAIGPHCPEGWEVFQSPGPKYQGSNVGADWMYAPFVDRHNTFGLGEGVPIIANASGEEILAFLPKEKKFVQMRVPYPLGFTPFHVDGRIDNTKRGWKGRGLWSTSDSVVPMHQETGEGSSNYAVHFQLRPTPLAE